jgi:hypothetical protein
MHISVCHCVTAGAAVTCAVVKAVASGAHRRCHLSQSGQAIINCWKGIIVEGEEGQRVINPVHFADDCALVYRVTIVRQPAALPEGARHIDLLTEALSVPSVS